MGTDAAVAAWIAAGRMSPLDDADAILADFGLVADEVPAEAHPDSPRQAVVAKRARACSESSNRASSMARRGSLMRARNGWLRGPSPRRGQNSSGGHVALKLKTNLSVVQQRLPYGGTCLPLTMELARLVRPALLPVITATPQAWSFEDRVLVLLAPSLRADIERFHEGTAQAMVDAFEPHQVEHLDRSFLEQLFALVERLSPSAATGIAQALTDRVAPVPTTAKG